MSNPEFDQKKMMYIHSLLNETMPLGLLTEDLLKGLSIDREESFGLIHIYYNTAMRNAIEARDSDYVADWKTAIHDHMLMDFNAPFITYSCILNLVPYTRTLVYSFKMTDLSLLENHIRKWFDLTKEFLGSVEDANLMAFANPKLTPLKDIGKLYKELRELQNYQYVIGMGTLTFFDDYPFKDDYSITEYKYIQRFENLLNVNGFDRLTHINTELVDYIRHHGMKDSKVIYLYKELMSVMIRFLYSHETQNLKLIEALNLAINDFPNRFNDLTEVADYIHELLMALKSSTLKEESHHPHIHRILTIIEDSYQEDLTLDSIAAAMNLSAPHLSRLFKDELGISFKQYLTRYRLDRIKELLRTTNKTIKEIAELTGYQSAAQMTRIFKKYEQMTPRAYRQN